MKVILGIVVERDNSGTIKKLYRVRRENFYTLTKHLFSSSVKFFSTHPVGYYRRQLGTIGIWELLRTIGDYRRGLK